MASDPSESGATEARGGPGVPERWSTQRKADVVLPLPRGEDRGELSREIQVSPLEVKEWRRVFMETASRA
jgi:hypothetical protein